MSIKLILEYHTDWDGTVWTRIRPELAQRHGLESVW